MTDKTDYRTVASPDDNNPTNMTAHRLYDSPKYGHGTVSVAVTDFSRRPDLCSYEQSEVNSLASDQTYEAIRFSSIENIKTTVRFESRDGATSHNKCVSLSRGYRNGPPSNPFDMAWSSTALVLDSYRIYYNSDELYRTQLQKEDTLWDYSTDEYLSWEDLLQELLVVGVPQLFGNRHR